MGLWGLFMDSKKKEKKARDAYRPYFKESMDTLIRSVLIILCILTFSVAFSLVYENYFYLFATFAVFLYVICDCVLNYRLVILALIERKKNEWICEEIEVVRIKDEWVWSGYLWKSRLSKLYPKEMHVGRYKLECKNKEGKKINLRSVMSGKKYQILNDRIFYSRSTKCLVSFGRYTKIIMHYESNEKWTDQLNHIIL